MLRAHAFAKINLTLRVLGLRDDGFHELRTVYQSLALHDTLVLEQTAGPFEIVCSDPDCPADDRNLVWRAAEALARHARRPGAIRHLRVRITKRIPLEAGLGGGSSDAAAMLRLLARAWKLTVDRDDLREIAASLGADVPYFLDGGTVLGLERGDLLFTLEDLPPAWVVIEVPPFGVRTKDAYAWWDRQKRADPSHSKGRSPDFLAAALSLPATEVRNDLQRPVADHHTEIKRIVSALWRNGAEYAAMSGSGSAVFGLFRSRSAAGRCVSTSARTGRRVVLTRTVGRREYAVLANSR